MKRLFVLGCALLALLVVVLAFGLASRGILYEYWEIWRLGSRDEGTRLSAAKWLGELRSLRAAPYLVRAIEEEEREEAKGWKKDSYQPGYSFTPLSYALYRIGPSALPALERLTKTEKMKQAPMGVSGYGLGFEDRLGSIRVNLYLAWSTVLCIVEEVPYGRR